MSAEPEIAKDAVLKRSECIPADTPQVHGYDFNQGINYSKLLESYAHTGFQATNLGLAIREINKMVSCFAFWKPHYTILYTGSWIAGLSRWALRSRICTKRTSLSGGAPNAPFFWVTPRIWYRRACERRCVFWPSIA